eukprot:5676998-Pleurochrysis_carterae.AAC.1
MARFCCRLAWWLGRSTPSWRFQVRVMKSVSFTLLGQVSFAHAGDLPRGAWPLRPHWLPDI